MPSYVPSQDKFGRLLARCPDCHKAWRTGEPWDVMIAHVRIVVIDQLLEAEDIRSQTAKEKERLISFLERSRGRISKL